MSYEAIVCRIKTQLHPNADKLLVGDAAGYSVIVGVDTVDGDLGVLFPEGGCIEPSFCLANGLYRKHPTTGEPLGGYLDEDGRVRALKLRGAVSDGLWLPIASIDKWLSSLKDGGRTSVPVLTEGQRIAAVKGHQLCEKYVTPATRRAIAAAGPMKARLIGALPRHYDTPQLRDLHSIPEGATVITTEKIHGTSGRTGLVRVEQPRGWLRRLFRLPAKTRLEYVSGTRNCTLDASAPGEKGQSYRRVVHDDIVQHAGLQPDEVWYYEISGYTLDGAPIMARHTVGSIGDTKLEKKLRASFGDAITYSYGCRPGEYVVHVYRITQGARELTYDEIAARCSDARARGAAVSVVPRMGRDEGMSGIAELRHVAALLANGQAPWTHPREGVCVRFERGGEVISKAYKHKSFVFCALEGIARNDAEYVDAEEVA